MTPARAAARPVARPAQPALRPAPTPRPRPDLRLVDPNELSPRIRRRRAAVAGVGLLVLVFGVLFALAASQAILAQNQQRLDRLEDDVADAQARYQRLRLHVAELESPGRIVRAAQERLGMVPPPGTTYLSPSGAVAD
jgi:cell division protein FtsL